MLSPQWLDELRSRITLSSVIGRTTRLQKAGHEFKACCPFHNEKSPSFTVNDAKGFYHCFGCGAHGDVIRWMTDQRGLAFMDAVKELAAEAGMEVPAPDPRAAKQAEQRDSLHDVTRAAQDWFVAQLAGPEGEKARAYLATRGFDPHTVQRFGFGYAPEGRQALKAALGRFPEDKLIEAGLRIAVEEREPYDRFRGRLMLPIEDARGRVIGFGGRILDKSKTDAPKYLNSPDTPLFDKGRTLYNLHRAGPASRQTGRMIVVEGYMDVIALAAAGFTEAVAPLGTALTEHQLTLLWRMVETPTLCFDGDAAGQRAALRAVTRALPLLKPAHSLRIVRLPAGLDPDDLLRQQGPAAFEALLGAAQPLIDTLWEHERDALPLATPEDKAGLKARLLAHVETIGDPDIRALYRRELLERFSDHAFPRREGSSEWRAQPGGRGPARGGRPGSWRNPPPLPPAEATMRFVQRGAGGQRQALGAAVLLGLARWPQLIARHAEALLRSDLPRSPLAPLLDALLDAAEQGQALETHHIATTLAQRNMTLPSAADCGNIPYPFLQDSCPPDWADECLTAAIGVLVEGPALDAAIAAATERFDIEEQGRLRARRDELDNRLKALMRG
ncbi:DNA primase [Novosphingobium piscinae]|uniref:DNA primase n=1 Tax=Novosphingobium piscinae TaxID=1507448 RepID=A0A7X1KQC5_9SPHN|nr:DNA primase [Novosphingobium piscinae]MBC2669388.1 DNA primase [Novosphingobium piscinae]